MKKTALVTGATGELGSRIIKKLVALDYSVIALHHNEEKFNSIYSKEKNEKNITGIECDLNNLQSVMQAIQKIKSNTESIDLIVTTASPKILFSKLVNIPPEKIVEDVSVIYVSHAAIILGLLALMKKGSRIINVITSAVDELPMGMGSYVSAKYALDGFSKILAKELKSSGIEVICIYPSMMETPLVSGIPDIVKRQVQEQQGLSKPEDVAESIVSIATGKELKQDKLKHDNELKEMLAGKTGKTKDKIQDVAIDLELNERFKLGKEDAFIKNNFSGSEIAYCFSKSRPEVHLAGLFCIKEAYFKLTNNKLLFKDIEVLHDKSGKPSLWLNEDKRAEKNKRNERKERAEKKKKKIKEISERKEYKISISHSDKYSVGIILLRK